MSLLPLQGRARVLGNDVNTDYIVSSRRKKETIDPHLLRRYLLEDLLPSFAASVRDGDVIVAGRNFGCGSAMEVAVTALLAAGIRAVIAQSFARTYLRNAMNNGLLAVIADTGGRAEGGGITEGQRVRLAFDESGALRLCKRGRAPASPATRSHLSCSTCWPQADSLPTCASAVASATDRLRPLPRSSGAVPALPFHASTAATGHFGPACSSTEVTAPTPPALHRPCRTGWPENLPTSPPPARQSP